MPAEVKVVAWLQRIGDALARSSMPAGEMSKLSGALSWGACALFHRMGRAALRLFTLRIIIGLACLPVVWQAAIQARARLVFGAR